MINDGAIIACHQTFKWKIFFQKPFRYIIQIITGKYCHVAIHFDGYIYDSSIKGSRSLKLNDWINEYCDMGMKMKYYNLNKDLSEIEMAKLKQYFKDQEGKDYSFIAAAFSAIDDNNFKIMPKNHETFCSYFTSKAYEYIKRLRPRKNETLDDPNEFIKRMKKQDLIKKREEYVF